MFVSTSGFIVNEAPNGASSTLTVSEAKDTDCADTGNPKNGVIVFRSALFFVKLNLLLGERDSRSKFF